jgi:GT2 family glycosyltransferase/SAM-dependent methyltransferase
MIPVNAPLFSIIVPTRGRPDGLRRLLDSFKATTRQLNSLEVILVVDSDDPESLEFVYDPMPLKRVVVQPGLKMGALNMAGYHVSEGQYVMLLNDDVIVRTQNWDDRVLESFRTFADGIVLVHVNDRIFGDKLCTFPFLSKQYCELAGGICPNNYVRYRIDDHIYNVFNLLAVMGKVRIVYLPDVVFEHTNYVLTSSGGTEYRPDERTHAVDTNLFDQLLPERKKLALQLMAHIDGDRSSDINRVRRNVLEPIADSVALRRPEYVRVSCDGHPLPGDQSRVTIGVVSANLRADHARTCIDLVKKYTKNFDLVILDNNSRSTFNHPHEMNKLLSMCDTDYLVLMDDDVFVEPGWLENMLGCLTPPVGVVTPLHKDVTGKLSYAGVVMRPDYSGRHTHSFAVSHSAARIQTLCSAVVLIDLNKCGHIRFDESYSKYFLDIDYGLQVWSQGYEVVCSPDSMVTHIGGGTLQHGSPRSNDLVEFQRRHFVREWIETRRYHELEQGIWQEIPEIKALLNVPKEVMQLLGERSATDRADFCDRAVNLFRFMRSYPAIWEWAHEKVWEAVGNLRPSINDPELGHFGFLLACGPYPNLVEQDYEDLNIVMYNADFYAIPQTEGAFEQARTITGGYSRWYQAETMESLKARIRADIHEMTLTPVQVSLDHQPHNDPILNNDPILIEEINGLNVIGYNSRYFAIPQGEGAFDYDRIVQRAYSRCYQAETVAGLKAEIQRENRDQNLWHSRFKKWRRKIKKKARQRSRLPISNDKDTSRVHNQNIFRNPLIQGVADPANWLSKSPVDLVEDDYHGYAIYAFEYKYFAVPRDLGPFNYEDFRQGKYGSCLIGHSLTEVHDSTDQFLSSTKTNVQSRNLVFACLPPSQLKPLLNRVYPPGSASLLVDRSFAGDWPGYKVISIEQGSLLNWSRSINSKESDALSQRLLGEQFERIIIPWSFPQTWADNSLEIAASRLSNSVEILHCSGEQRLFRGENLHRLGYNKAYLASMFEVVPPPNGKTILEAGCSDGLVCDIFSLLGASKVIGIDVMKTVGCGFKSDRIEYHIMDAASMNFPDKHFDIAYSIATFEHLADPYKALSELLRVTKVGGHVYVQAGPLYCSPFGHHMFAYFQDFPWIHLRKSKDQIITFAKERGIDKLIERDLATTCEKYIDGMLNVNHVNGLLLEDYRLHEFQERDDIEVLKFNISHEGDSLLTPQIIAEIPGVKRKNLVDHGFEIAFRRTK